jgi:DNA-binding cell septation regulator SpoVG
MNNGNKFSIAAQGRLRIIVKLGRIDTDECMMLLHAIVIDTHFFLDSLVWPTGNGGVFPPQPFLAMHV